MAPPNALLTTREARHTLNDNHSHLMSAPMDEFEVTHPQDPSLAIAAVMFLLSGASLRGTSSSQCAALLQHLERLACSPDISPALRHTCAELHSTWSRVIDALGKEHTCPCCRPDGPVLH